ncbi:MAG: hypothetical protein LUP93_02930, partial [Methanomicrobiales archaeon]|nr:hypothetical protein [Methanomicrobiales archaeon]
FQIIFILWKGEIPPAIFIIEISTRGNHFPAPVETKGWVGNPFHGQMHGGHPRPVRVPGKSRIPDKFPAGGIPEGAHPVETKG